MSETAELPAPDAGAIVNIAAYRFVEIADPPTVAAWLLDVCVAAALKGSVLVAPEGLNLFLAGSRAAVAGALARIGEDARFSGLSFKASSSDTVPFRPCAYA